VAEFQLNNNFIQAGGAFMGFSQQPNQKLFLITPDAPDYAWRCRFSNFGKTAVLNVVAEFTLNFLEVIKTDKSTASGKIIKSDRLMTLPFTLEPHNGKMDLYFRNFSFNAFAEVLLPISATAQIPRERHTALVQVSARHVWWVWFTSV
jgi:hypothetical protein